jgi:hypothetical protein
VLVLVAVVQDLLDQLVLVLAQGQVQQLEAVLQVVVLQLEVVLPLEAHMVARKVAQAQVAHM